MVNITKKENTQPREMQAYEPQISPFSLIDRFFDDAWDPFNVLTPSLFRNRSLGAVNTLFPKVDVSETDNEIKVVANIPGIDPEKIDIEVGDDYLSLSGKIEKESTDERNGKVYRFEREFGEFRREFSLPARVSKENIVARAKNGVLSITLPKSEDERKAKIKVEVEK
ncbi:MAG TPA: Hsp20/alpha crystallin family protein [Candidatus Paceibacterota bacterium]|nr:Hsp20/alpha crystallin family protein [Candidatus Paceibacterota bacterium]